MANSPFFPSTISLVGQTASPATTQNSDTTQSAVSLGREGALMTADTRATYGTMAHRGGVFWAATTTAAQLVDAITASSLHFGLINPAGSGVMAEVIDFDLNQLAAGPATQNIMGFSVIPPTNAPTAVTATPGPIRAGGNPSNFAGATPACTHFSVATVTALSIAANWGVAMFSFPASFFPTAALNFGPYHYNFNGKLVVPPGWSIALVASTAWGANTAIPAMSWAEYKI